MSLVMFFFGYGSY